MAEHFIVTRASQGKTEKEINFTSVSFASSKPKQAKKRIVPESSTLQSGEEFNIKKAKHEVVKLGTSGLDSHKKEDAKIQLAIKLGAKPPKNKYKNYKKLKEELAQRKETEHSNLKFQQMGKNALGKASARIKIKKKGKGGLLDVYGKVKTKDISQA